MLSNDEKVLVAQREDLALISIVTLLFPQILLLLPSAHERRSNVVVGFP